MSFEEEPIAILDRQVRKLRNKEITSVKVHWKNRPVREATWEIESENLKVVLVNKTNYLVSEEKLIYQYLYKINDYQNNIKKFINPQQINEQITLDVEFIDYKQIQERYQFYNINDFELFLDLEKFLPLIKYDISPPSTVCDVKHDLDCDNFKYLQKKANNFLTYYLQKNINIKKHIFYIQQLQ
ncbi:MAG: hypothetical protein Q8738_02415, partial [Candidatus Phytoplasma australasiaticum]|nr:hypothetical protein [Candidatus Phytoplasma australasiaticum]